MFILNIRQMMPAIYPGKELRLEFVYPRPEVRADFLLNIADTTKNRQRRPLSSLGKRTATTNGSYFHHLNAATIKSNYPLGRIGLILQELSKAFLKAEFTRDAANGYDDDRERSGRCLIPSNRFVFGENARGYFKKSVWYSLSA
jgi:hypothetical protein